MPSAGTPVFQLLPCFAPSTLLTSLRYTNEGSPTFCSIQALSGSEEAHPHWERPSALFSPSVQMLVLPETQTHPERMFNQIAGHPTVPSTSHVKLTIAGNMNILWTWLEI